MSTNLTRFMRIPFFVSGYCVTEENMEAVAKWCEGHVIRDTKEPFVRVPVTRPSHPRQTEACVDMWVIKSELNGRQSYKVYTNEWLRKQFFELPDDAFPGIMDEPDDLEGLNITRGVATVPTQRSSENTTKDLSAHVRRPHNR